MLLNGSNFRIDCFDAGASVGNCTDFTRVTFQSAINECVGLAFNVSGSFGIGESLIGGSLLETGSILRG